MTRRPSHDFNQFLTVLRRTGLPSHLPFYEHIASPEFIAARTRTPFDRMQVEDDDYWRIYVDFWMGLGFDCVPLERRRFCRWRSSSAGTATA